MEEKQAYQKDLESIRKLMERSVKFISLSGLSGIMAGIYALLGALSASFLIPSPLSNGVIPDQQTIIRIFVIALVVLVASLVTGFWMSNRKAKKAGVKFWDATSKRLVINLAIPLVTGGLFIIILLLSDHVGIVAPSFLIFYGLALINASPNLFEEIRYLGYSEILLGLLCAAVPHFGLLFWAIGFGLFHILYGAVMYKKYDA
jgi:uncharacterized membrane protein